MAEVKLNDVIKRYGNNEIVKKLSLHVFDGEFLVLVGASGCGKSTTLRMVAGLEQADSGEIWIGNRIVNDLPPKERDIAMVFQNYALYPHMNIFDNIAFGLRLRKLNNNEVQQRVQHAAEMLGIETFLSRKPKELSGGQRQRVALARALVREPYVYLMDEPLSNLDAKLRAQTRTEIKKLHQQVKTTTIYVTHDQVEAMTMGDRIAVMKDGIIQQLASPKQTYEFPDNLFVAGFIGSPSMNFLKVKLSEIGKETITVQSDGLNIKLPIGNKQKLIESYLNKEVVIGIRPEYIYLPSPNEKESTEYREMNANIEVIEPSGSNTYLHISVGKHNLITELETALIEGLKVGNKIKLLINTARLHLFDPSTEKTIISIQAIAN